MEEELLPPAAGDGCQQLVKYGGRGTPAANGWRWPPTAGQTWWKRSSCRQQLCRPMQPMVRAASVRAAALCQRLDAVGCLGAPAAAPPTAGDTLSCHPARARELRDEPHAAFRQWSDMPKQQLKTVARIRPPGRLLVIFQAEKHGVHSGAPKSATCIPYCHFQHQEHVLQPRLSSPLRYPHSLHVHQGRALHPRGGHPKLLISRFCDGWLPGWPPTAGWGEAVGCRERGCCQRTSSQRCC